VAGKEVAVKKYVVRLNGEEYDRLNELIRKGKRSAQLLTKARILLKADVSDAGEGWSDSAIAAALDTSIATSGPGASWSQLLIEAGIRSVGNVKESFSDGVIAEWQTATAGRSRRGLQAQRDLHLAFANRLICETSLGTADREALMASCDWTLRRCLIS
jgi:hypothetical protein